MKFTSALINSYLLIGLINPTFFPIGCTGQTVPVNDVCTNATSITVGSTIQIDITNATLDTDITDDCFFNDGAGLPGLWYTFVGTGGILVARWCNQATWVSIFSGGCRSETLTCVAAENNGCLPGGLFFDTVVGRIYHMLVQSSPTEVIDLSIFTAPTIAPTRKPCGLLGLSIFCPFTFQGIFGRFIRSLFG